MAGSVGPRTLTSIDRIFDLSAWLSTRQDWKPRTKTRQCCADIRSLRAAKGWFFKRGYAGRVQALKAPAQRKHDQDEQQRRSEDAVDDHQGENSASGAVVEEFQFSRRSAVDLDLLSKSLPWTNTHCKRPLFLKMCTKSVKFGLANYLYIICSACGLENQCPTSSRLNDTSGRFAVSAIAAEGMVHAWLPLM